VSPTAAASNERSKQEVADRKKVAEGDGAYGTNQVTVEPGYFLAPGYEFADTDAERGATGRFKVLRIRPVDEQSDAPRFLDRWDDGRDQSLDFNLVDRNDNQIANAAGDVLPGTGGMSVAPGSMWNVPNHRRPRGMLRGSTGHAGDRVYSIEPAEIVNQPLSVRPHPPGSTLHAHVEPSRQMSLVAYEDALAATRPSWIQAWP
jgi:hypothetical protein